MMQQCQLNLWLEAIKMIRRYMVVGKQFIQGTMQYGSLQPIRDH